MHMMDTQSMNTFTAEHKTRNCGGALSILLTLVLTMSGVNAMASDAEPSGPSLIGIDHMPIGVRDLEQASNAYRSFGFTLKPGRYHDDGITNNHVKFKDGSGLELLCPPSKPVDSLTADYLHRIDNGDGPAFISFHARNTDKLVAALNSAGIRFKQDDLITLEDPLLDFLFFDQDNRSPTDRPEHFIHPNSAITMTGVWLALDNETRDRLTQLFLTLGAEMHEEMVAAPRLARVVVFTIQNGQVTVLPKSHQLTQNRPVIGAVFQVRDLHTAARYLPEQAHSHRLLVPPTLAHGLWLELRDR